MLLSLFRIILGTVFNLPKYISVLTLVFSHHPICCSVWAEFYIATWAGLGADWKTWRMFLNLKLFIWIKEICKLISPPNYSMGL